MPKLATYSKGQKVGTAVFLREVKSYRSPEGRRLRRAKFRCYCGAEFEALIGSLVSGNTKSCGCYDRATRPDRAKTHGKRGHPLYGVWVSMKTRCFNKTRADYKYYGGSKVSVSDEFRDSFEAWFLYVTKLENYKNRDRDKLTLDRIDNTKDYERGNLRWVTRKVQANNRRSGSGRRKFTRSQVVYIRQRHAGSETVPQLAKEYAVKWDTINNIVTRKSWREI